MDFKDVDEAKVAELLLYVAITTERDDTAGATKMHKILYFSELAHLRRYGRPITGALFQKLEHGPGLRRMRPIIQRLEEEGAAKEVERDHFGYPQKRLLALREPDLTRFTAEEIASVDGIIRQFWARSAREVSEVSHRDLGWSAVDYGEDIPYSLAFIVERDLSDQVILHAKELEMELAGRS